MKDKAERAEYDKQRKKIRAKRDISILKQELGGCCVACLSDEKLQFDHIDPKTKKFMLGSEAGRISLPKLRVEAEKCQLLCQTCHIIKHRIAGKKGTLVMSPDVLFTLP